MRTKPSKAGVNATKNQSVSHLQNSTRNPIERFNHSGSKEFADSEHQTITRKLKIAQKRKFLELRGHLTGTKKEEANKLRQLVSSFVQWCAGRKMPGIVVHHQGEQSLVSVYVPYPQLDEVRSLLQDLLPVASTETSAANQYYFTYECQNTSVATKLASTLATRFGSEQTSL